MTSTFEISHLVTKVELYPRAQILRAIEAPGESLADVAIGQVAGRDDDASDQQEQQQQVQLNHVAQEIEDGHDAGAVPALDPLQNSIPRLPRELAPTWNHGKGE